MPKDLGQQVKARFKDDVIYTELFYRVSDIFDSPLGKKSIVESNRQYVKLIFFFEDSQCERAILSPAITHKSVVTCFALVLADQNIKFTGIF